MVSPLNFSPSLTEPDLKPNSDGTPTQAKRYTIREADIAPIRDMARMKGLPSLQAESASSFSAMASDRQEGILSHQCFIAFGFLVEAESTYVGLPTARLCFCLAEKPEAEPHFKSSGLLYKITDKIGCRETNPNIRSTFAKALSKACVHQSAEEAQKLLEKINKKIAEIEAPDVDLSTMKMGHLNKLARESGVSEVDRNQALDYQD